MPLHSPKQQGRAQPGRSTTDNDHVVHVRVLSRYNPKVNLNEIEIILTESSFVETVVTQFISCNAGWIFFKMAAADRSVGLRASWVFDPFPDMVQWLEAVLTGVQQCSFIMDEEGSEKEFIASRHNEELLFVIHDPVDGQEFIRAEVSRKQLIANLYGQMRAFAESELYIPEEWECATLRDRLQSAFSGCSADRVISHLLRLSCRELGELFFRVAPSYLVGFPAEPTKSDELRRFVNLTMNPDDPTTSEGMVETPEEWKITADYDLWSTDQREEYLREMIDERVSGYGGCRLGDLKSSVLEECLASERSGKQE